MDTKNLREICSYNISYFVNNENYDDYSLYYLDEENNKIIKEYDDNYERKINRFKLDPEIFLGEWKAQNMAQRTSSVFRVVHNLSDEDYEKIQEMIKQSKYNNKCEVEMER